MIKVDRETNAHEGTPVPELVPALQEDRVTVHMLTSQHGSENGIHVFHYEEGNNYVMSASLADTFIKEKFAEKVLQTTYLDETSYQADLKSKEAAQKALDAHAQVDETLKGVANMEVKKPEPVPDSPAIREQHALDERRKEVDKDPKGLPGMQVQEQDKAGKGKPEPYENKMADGTEQKVVSDTPSLADKHDDEEDVKTPEPFEPKKTTEKKNR